MCTETIEIYTFDELTEDAQKRVLDYFRNDGGMWAWSSEWWESAQAFSEIAPIDITEADYDRAHVTVNWTGDSDVAELSGVRAWKWLLNNGWFTWAKENKRGACTMTGYIGDCSFADPLVAYESKPNRIPDLKQVFYECAQSWVSEARQDLEYAYSDEGIRDLLECNAYEFTKDGSIY